MPSEKNFDAVFRDTANAIRNKLGTLDTIQPIDFADKINLITGAGKEEVILNATHNGTFYPPEGKVYSKAVVNTPEPKQELKLTATTNSIYMPPSGFVYNEVEVNVPAGTPSVLKEFRIDRSLPGDPYNKIITATDYDCDGFSKVVVNLPRPKNEEIAVIDLNLYSGDQTVLPNTNGVFTKAIVHKPTTLRPYNIKKGINIAGVVGTLETGSTIKLQPEKTINPKTSRQTINPDSGYDGLSSVVINPVSSSIDPNIKSENIKKGINILGVQGSLVEGETTTGIVMPPYKNFEYARDSLLQNLGNKVSAEQLADIRSGLFETMNIGDYWEMNGFRFFIAGFDWFYDDDHMPGDLKKHHLIIIPEATLGFGTMVKGSSEGGYLGSYMRRLTLPSYEKEMNSEHYFNGLLLTHKVEISTSIGGGSAGITGLTWMDAKLELLSCRMVMGYDYAAQGKTDMEHQLPIFKMRPRTIDVGEEGWWWLRDPWNQQSYLAIYTDSANNGKTSLGYYDCFKNAGIRPYFLIG